MKSWLSRLRKYGLTRWLSALTVGLLLCCGAWLGLRRAGPGEQAIGYTELSQLAATGGANEVHVDADRFEVRQASGKTLVAFVDDAVSRHDLVQRFAAAGIPLTFESKEQPVSMRILAPFVALGLVGALLVGVQRRRGKGHFVTVGGKGTGRPSVRFADVAGMDEVKEALAETVEFLSNPARFGRLGGRAPRGVLLTGAPGTGKTLLARAVASEAGVPFLSASGSAFQEMFVGVGASRVRSLFAEARSAAPCIVFIDEIDALGRARGSSGDAASADHDQTLNQLLVEMDGFDGATGIVVVASTNRPDVLDPAILRPGRFDRRIVVPLPDLRGRKQILAVHARPIELGPEVDLARVARCTPGFSGADLANLLNEAAILAAREDATAVAHAHIERARDRILMGLERRGLLVDPEERHATAVHEAGHVAVGIAAPHADPVHQVTILPRGHALGATQSLPERERVMYRREYLEDQLCLMLGGRAAELVLLGTMTAGAADDLERATSLARKMVGELGMSELGPICLKDPRSPASQGLLDRVEEATRGLLDAQLERAKRLVAERRAEIGVLVERLLEEETLQADAIRACFPRDAGCPAT